MFFPFELFKYSFEAMLRIQRAYAENIAALLALNTKANAEMLEATHVLQSLLTFVKKRLPYHAEGNVLVIDRTPTPHTYSSFLLGSPARLYQFSKFNSGA